MSHLIFRVHAIQRMFQRRISVEDVEHVLSSGETIEEYPDDSPYPSRLILGRCGGRAVHVVAADIKKTEETIVITVYEPSIDGWERDYKRRKK